MHRLPPVVYAIFFACVSAISHGLYLIEQDWGAMFVSAYPESDAHYYFHLAWFKAFVSSSPSLLDHVIPFSPYIESLTFAFKLFGPHLILPFCLNAFFASVSCLFVVLASERCFGAKTALVAGTLFCLCGIFIFYSSLSAKSLFVLMGASAWMYCMLSAIKIKFWPYFVCAVILTALISMERENFIVMIIPMAWVAVQRSVYYQTKHSVKLVSVSACIIALILSLQIIGAATDRVFDTKGLKNSISINFLLGNGPHADGAYSAISGLENNIIGMRLGVMNALEDELGRPPSTLEFHSYLMSPWLEHYAQHPVKLVTLKLKHLAALLAQYSYGFPEQYALWRWQSIVTSLAFVDWSLLLALSLFACFRIGRKHLLSQHHLFLLSSILLYSLSVFAFLVTERYRLVLYILLLPYAAYALTQVMGDVKGLAALRKPGKRSRPNKRFVALYFALVSIWLASLGLKSALREGAGWPENFHEKRAQVIQTKQKRVAYYSKLLDYSLMSEMQRLQLARQLLENEMHLDAIVICKSLMGSGNKGVARGAEVIANKARDAAISGRRRLSSMEF